MLYETLLSSAFPILLALFVSALIFARKRRPHNIPPGPFSLPLIGNLTALSGDRLKATEKLRHKFGDIYSLYIGDCLTVFVHGYKNLKEVLVTRGDDFADRPERLFFKRGEGTGISIASGHEWKEQRQFALHTLRELGVGRSSVEGKIREEVEFLLKCIEDKDGEPFESGVLLQTLTANVICSVSFGRRFDHHDPTFQRYLKGMTELLEAAPSASMVNVIPWLKLLPGDIFKYHAVWGHVDEIAEFSRKEIRSHKETFDPNDPRDFIDAYFLELSKHQEEHSTFHEPQLVKILGDLFIAGTETTSTTMKWVLLYMISYPEIQKKVRDELHSVIGDQRLPTVADRRNLPYAEATLMEIQRHADIAPLSVAHAASVDTSLAGYFIPKGTVIMPVISSALKDPEIWCEPDIFSPDRFLNSDGTLHKPEEFIPFSAGKRVCLGESLAKMELFLFTTAMVQRFTLKRPEGNAPPSLEGIVGLSRAPHPFELCAVFNI